MLLPLGVLEFLSSNSLQTQGVCWGSSPAQFLQLNQWLIWFRWVEIQKSELLLWKCLHTTLLLNCLVSKEQFFWFVVSYRLFPYCYCNILKTEWSLYRGDTIWGNIHYCVSTVWMRFQIKYIALGRSICLCENEVELIPSINSLISPDEGWYEQKEKDWKWMWAGRSRK